MSAFRVDTAQLADVVEQMARFDAQLLEALDHADSTVTRLHATWTGAAAEQHAAAHRQWREGAARMQQALGVMRSIADTAHANYSGAAGANAQMWAL